MPKKSRRRTWRRKTKSRHHRKTRRQRRQTAGASLQQIGKAALLRSYTTSPEMSRELSSIVHSADKAPEFFSIGNSRLSGKNVYADFSLRPSYRRPGAPAKSWDIDRLLRTAEEQVRMLEAQPNYTKPFMPTLTPEQLLRLGKAAAYRSFASSNDRELFNEIIHSVDVTKGPMGFPSLTGDKPAEFDRVFNQSGVDWRKLRLAHIADACGKADASAFANRKENFPGMGTVNSLLKRADVPEIANKPAGCENVPFA